MTENYVAKMELRLIKISIGILIPITFFFLFWWTVAGLSLYHVIEIPEEWIRKTAISGLGFGILLNIVLLKRLVSHFYRIDTRVFSLLYIFYSVGLLALFMGVPVCNLILGVIAGAYMSRRMRYDGINGERWDNRIGKTSLFTAIVMGFIAAVSGILAIFDHSTPSNLRMIFPFCSKWISRQTIIGIVAIGWSLLIWIQYKITQKTAVFIDRWFD